MPKLELHEWTRHHLYSAFVVSKDLPSTFDVMNQSQGLPMLGAPTEYAKRIHTSLVRPGSAGLPRGWEFFVLAWRFSANRPLTEPILEWASETNVEFTYNHKRYARSPMHELLHGEKSISGDDFIVNFGGDSMRWSGIPVWMRESVPFEVSVDATSIEAQTARAKLLDVLQGQRLVVWGYVSGYLKTQVT